MSGGVYRFRFEVIEGITSVGKKIESAFGAMRDRATSFGASINRLPNTISQIETKIEALRAAQRDSFDASEVRRYANEIANLERQMQGLTGSGSGMNGGMRMLAMNAMSEAATNVLTPMREASTGAFSFNRELAELEAMTGVTGAGLDMIANNARETAKTFGGNSADYLRGYTTLLSKLTPEIAKNPVALKGMGDTVAVLSKTMRGDAPGAVEAITASMNQFGVDLKNPTEAAKQADIMMNQMVMSAKVGSQEVSQVKDGLEASGAAAKAAGVSFAETNAALQVMGKYGKEGAEGGIALRNVLALMQREDFIPKEQREQLVAAGVDIKKLGDTTIPFTERLKEMKKVSGDNALLGAFFGTENIVAARGMLDNIALIDEYTGAIKQAGNAGREYAATVGASYEEVRNKIVARWDDIKLSIFNGSGSMLPYIDVAVGALGGFVQVMPGIMATGQAIQALAASQRLQAIWSVISATVAGGYGKVMAVLTAQVSLQALWTGITTGATSLFSGAMSALNAVLMANPIGFVVVALAALAAGAAYAWNNFEGFRGGVYALWEAVKTVFGNISSFFKQTFGPMFAAIDAFKSGNYAEAAKQIGKQAFNLTPVGMIATARSGKYESVGGAYEAGKAKGVASFRADKGLPTAGQKPAGLGGVQLPGVFGGQKPLIVQPMADVKPTTKPDSIIPPSDKKDKTKTTSAAGGLGVQAGIASVSGEKAGVQNRNITIGKLVERLEIHVTNLTEGSSQVKRLVEEALMTAVNDSNYAA